MTDNRDLKQLSALLAKASASPAQATSQPQAKKPTPVPANDNRAPDVLAWPAFERLVHRGDAARAFALRHWKNLCQPGSGYEPEPESDNAGEEQLEVRPSEAELLRAVGWTVTGSERWEHTGKSVNTYEPEETKVSTKRNRNGGLDTSVGHLLFRDGKLVAWGVTKKGMPLKPVERPRGAKGGLSTERSEAAIWKYIKTPADTPSPFAAMSFRRPYSNELAIMNCYDPLPREEPNAKDRHGRFGVEEARRLLREHGVDGSVPFNKLPIEATLCPDGLVVGPQWIGGIKKPKPLGEMSAPAGREPEFVRIVEMGDHLANLRRHLGDNAKVLDLAITDATAKEIGIAMGKAPAYAEKVGPLLIDAALDALLWVDETARSDISTKEQKIAA